MTLLKGESIKKPQGTLILEGGAMRGIFTAAVLDAFMERGYYFPEIASISAGTMQALCYLSRQRGRNCKVNLTYAADKRYMGVRHMLHGGSHAGSLRYGNLYVGTGAYDGAGYRL